MHTGIPRKTFSSSTSAFKPVLNNKSSSSATVSRLPTSRLPTSSNKKTAISSSRSFKENIPPVASNSKKQGSTRSTALQKSSNSAEEHKIEKKNNVKGVGLEDVQCIGSKHKDEEDEVSFTYPVLVDLSTSKIVNANENSRIDFDYNVIDYDREYDVSLKLESSLYETGLAARHNDSIQVTLKRKRIVANDKDEASISLDYIPESDVEGVWGVEYIIDDEEADDTFDLSDFLSKNAPPTAPPTAPLPPLPPLPTVPAPAPVTTEEADDTFDLSDFLDKNTPVLGDDRLLDTSISDLMKVEIDYDREFPNTAIGRPPHIFVCRYKRDMKRKAAEKEKNASAEKEGNRCVLDNECIIDLPLQSWAPTFNAKILSPEKSKLEAAAPLTPSIPSLIVTSPSDGDIVCVPDREPPVFDEKVIEYGVHKYFLLDASYHNWCLRFGVPLPDDEEEEEEEEEEQGVVNVPRIIITDTDPVLERLQLEFGDEGPLDEIY